jgi:hypothetical protein
MRTSLYSLIWEASKLTAPIAEGNATGSLSCEAMPFDMKAGESLIIRNKFNATILIELDADVTAGSTTISYEPRPGGTILQIPSEIPVGSSLLLMGSEISKQGRRKSQMFINFSSQAVASQYWTTFSSSGISNHSWNTVTSDNGTTVGTSQITNISTSIQSTGIVIPFNCTLLGFRATTYRVGNHQSAVGLFVGTPTYNDNATKDFTLRAYAAADNSAGPDSNYSQRPVKAEDLTRNFSLSAGDVILPAFNSVTNNGGNFRANYQIVLQYDLL